MYTLQYLTSKVSNTNGVSVMVRIGVFAWEPCYLANGHRVGFCVPSQTYCLVEVYRYQIFLFSDIRYSLFKKKPIPIADPIYVTSCFSHALHIIIL